MAGDFDPYYKWLGIPPQDQPPHYYRLLGINLFESDAEVIATAADQRLMLVRSFKTGPNAILAQKLEKKIESAKHNLLDPAKKAEYDVSLRLQLRLPTAPVPPPRPSSSGILSHKTEKHPSPPPAAPPPPPKSTDAQTSGGSSANPLVALRESFDLLFQFLRRHKKTVSLIKKLVIGAVVIIVILLIFVHGKDLWNFTFDKTSALVAKITGSSEGKVPERIVKTRTIPGTKPEAHTDTTANQSAERPLPPPQQKTDTAVSPGQSGPAPPPPGPDNAQALPAPASAADATANNTLDNSAAVANNVPGPSADLATTPAAEIISLNLPSGKTFKTRLFKVSLNPIFELLRDPTQDEQAIVLFYPDKKVFAIAAHEKGVLNGFCMAFSEDRQPMVYANYSDGLLEGSLKTWNESGERSYWCQYEKGVRQGFCCYFKNNQLRLLLEIDHDTINSVHLCAGGALQKSFDSLEKATDDIEAQKLLDEMDVLEAELRTNENAFKKQVKEEETWLRREKSGPTSAQKRILFQERLNQCLFEGPLLIKNLRTFPNL